MNVRAGVHRDPVAGRTTFGVYVNIWYAAQDLARSTMDDYRRTIENHLLPAFEEYAMADISGPDIALWEKRERALGYAESSIRLWRATLHLILADAVDEGTIVSNPASRRRGKGKRTGRSRKRGQEKIITTALGVLLLAERAALLSGRDDEFVVVLLGGFSGMRWGELVGLETRYARPSAIRVEWQLYELDSGEFHRCPPKDGSRRTVHIPEWLSALATDFIGQTQPKPCACHGFTYTFSGNKAANGAVRGRDRS
jgi:integrase